MRFSPPSLSVALQCFQCNKPNPLKVAESWSDLSCACLTFFFCIHQIVISVDIWKTYNGICILQNNLAIKLQMGCSFSKYIYLILLSDSHFNNQPAQWRRSFQIEWIIIFNLCKECASTNIAAALERAWTMMQDKWYPFTRLNEDTSWAVCW